MIRLNLVALLMGVLVTTISSQPPPPPPGPTPLSLGQALNEQCGGIGYIGETKCRAPGVCCFYNKVESYCRPNSRACPGNSPTSTWTSTQPTSVTPSTTPITSVNPVWAQCGGVGFTGSTTCQSPSLCCYINPYHSQCVPPDYACPGMGISSSSSRLSSSSTTLSTVPTTSATRTTTSTAPLQTIWGQCGGFTFPGPFTCQPPAFCCYVNQWASQCYPPGYGCAALGISSTSLGPTIISTTLSPSTTAQGRPSLTSTASQGGQTLWGKCGGQLWTGHTRCSEGTCCYQATYNSQCLPEGSPCIVV